MNWPEKKPATVDELFSELAKYTDIDTWACRGHQQQWPSLLPKIDRGIDENVAHLDRLDREHTISGGFLAEARSLLSASEVGLLGHLVSRLMIMQHYGVPTRLLDWTRSPWIALYFACSASFDHDGEVLLFDRADLSLRTQGMFASAYAAVAANDYNNQCMEFFRDKTPEKILLIDPVFLNVPCASPRIGVQQSLFTLATPLGIDHSRLVNEVLPAGPNDKRARIVIAASIKPQCLKRLASMNVTSLSLFPGIDGLGRHLQDTLVYISNKSPLRNTMIGTIDGVTQRFVPPPVC